MYEEQVYVRGALLLSPITPPLPNLHTAPCTAPVVHPVNCTTVHTHSANAAIKSRELGLMGGDLGCWQPGSLVDCGSGAVGNKDWLTVE